MEIEVTAGIPNAYSQDDRRRFQELVRDGGEVDTAVLQQNVEAARSLVFASSGGKLLGVAALKRPKASYRRKIGKNSGIALNQDEYAYELGYVFVRESARGNGIAHRLVGASLKESDGKAVFGTVRTDNFGMLRALTVAGFLQIGHSYKGRNSGTLIQLLVWNNADNISAS